MSEVIVTHVKPGETLSEIAVQYGVDVDALQRWNRIEDPDLVLVGQKILVYNAADTADSSVSESAVSGTTSEPPIADGLRDIVVGGAIVVGLLLLLLLLRRKRRDAAPTSITQSSRQRLPVSPGEAPVAKGQDQTLQHSRPSSAVDPLPRPQVNDGERVIKGKAYVTDGDGIRIGRQEVRIAGIDAPEWDQKAKHQDGYWFNHGKRVKSALIQEVGGKHVRVSVEGKDKYGRLLGTVTCRGRDIGEWLVREGHAIAAYSDRFKHVEQEARKAKRGMWAHAHNFDPRGHRNR